MGGHEVLYGQSPLVARCIICNRIKQPMGDPVSSELRGMRCEPGCSGYLVDPPPPQRPVDFVRHGSSPQAVVGDQLLDVIGRALCEVHFGR